MVHSLGIVKVEKLQRTKCRESEIVIYKEQTQKDENATRETLSRPKRQEQTWAAPKIWVGTFPKNA